MKKETILVRDKFDYRQATPVSTPIFQTSAFHSGDPFFYTRKDNPNFREVEDVIKKLDNANHCVLYSSGMAAISSVLGLLVPGDCLVMNELLYGCTFRFILDFCHKYNIEIIIADLADVSIAETVISSKTTMLFFETPTNPFLHTLNIRILAELLHSRNPEGWVVVDNTWATPLFQNPLELGADIVVYSGSKYFGGHSDVMIGAGTTQSNELAKRLIDYRFYSGAVPDPFAAWLTRRSMQTLSIRMERHCKNTAAIVEFLRLHPLVERVYLPAVDGTQLKAYGGLLFVQPRLAEYSQVKNIMKNLKLFDVGTPMASVSSAIACPYHGSHLSMSATEKERIGLNDTLIRLSIGLEDPEDLIADLSQAFSVVLNDD